MPTNKLCRAVIMCAARSLCLSGTVHETWVTSLPAIADFRFAARADVETVPTWVSNRATKRRSRALKQTVIRTAVQVLQNYVRATQQRLQTGPPKCGQSWLRTNVAGAL